jgi:hypothetical protein
MEIIFKEEYMMSSTAAPSAPVNKTGYYSVNQRHSPGAGGEDGSASRSGAMAPSQAANAVSLSSEYYSADRMSVTYTSRDGDSVALSMEHIEYRKAMVTAQNDGASDDTRWNAVVDQIKDEFSRMKQDMITKFMESITGIDNDTNTLTINNPTDSAAGADSGSEIAGLPEYWNAENTSQRIVDFATSFSSLFQGAGEDFLSMIKSAIEDGFSQAHDMLGELPGPVGKLVDDTHSLVSRKLDAWAKANGIGIDEQAPAV